MDNSSPPPTSQETNGDGKCVISLRNLSVYDPGTVPLLDSVPSSSQVSNGTQLQESRMPTSPATPFPDLPTPQQVSSAPVDRPANLQTSANGGDSNGGLFSLYPPIYGTNISEFSPVEFDNSRFVNDLLLWNHDTDVHQGQRSYSNLGSESPPPVYLQLWENPNWALASPPPVNIPQPEDPPPPPGFNFFEMAISPDLSEQLRRILLQGKYVRETLRAVFPSIILLMTDRHGQRIFGVLLEKCENCDLYALVKKMTEETDSFIGAAFCQTGSRSIQRLIKRLKNTGLETFITQMLSKFALYMMTHRIASHVIRQCFRVLGQEPNRVLHEFVIENFLPLALYPTGSMTINECIDSITGGRRALLLSLVIDHACQLSCDPSGNFVVQHVLEFHNDIITERICLALKGHLVQLAQKKGGSRVVEKCLCSHIGRELAEEEIFKNEKTISRIARDQFGNYVIQAALRRAKMHDRDMYRRLVEALEPSHSRILQKVNAYFDST